MARTARRRRKQAENNYRHLARLGRPIYKHRKMLDISTAILRERLKAKAEIKRRSNK